MNVPRYKHSSCSLHDRIYVVCGINVDGDELKSIEFIGIRAGSTGAVLFVQKTWTKCDPDGLTPSRDGVLVAPIGESELLVYGGCDHKDNVLAEGIVYNIITKKTIKRVEQQEYSIISRCNGYWMKEGHAIALVNVGNFTHTVVY